MQKSSTALKAIKIKNAQMFTHDINWNIYYVTLNQKVQQRFWFWDSDSVLWRHHSCTGAGSAGGRWDSKQPSVFAAHFNALPSKHVTVHPPAEAESTESYLSSNPWRRGHSSGGGETHLPEERWRRCGAAACGAPSGSSPAGRSADSRGWRRSSSGADWPAAPASIRRTCSATSAASTPSSSPTMEASGWCPVRSSGSARWSY